MPEPIADYSPEAVIEAIETNLVLSTLALGRGEDSVVFRGSDAAWVYTGHRSLNRVLRSRFLSDEAEDRVASIVACFQRWKAQVSWFVGPTSFPPEVSEYLRDNGFSPAEIWMGAAADLSAIKAPKNTGGLRIERITSKEHFQAWASVSSEHWNPGEGATEIFTPDNAGSDSACRYYLGLIGSEPVVRGMACVHAKIAGLYWISAKPEHRSKPYNVALASHALHEARAAGARLGVMPIRGTTNALCQKLGFNPYCQFQVYTWPAAASAPLC
jgi:GNAT superfamily N-acetyltransferase